MTNPQLPSVELIQGAPMPAAQLPARRRRWRVFFTVLLLALAIGLAIVYGRSPVYRSTAAVLTVKPKAVDARSAEADAEHVAIQGRLLLGEELLGRLSRQLAEQGEEAFATTDRLRGALAVVAVPATNLLELRAEGGDPAQLQRVVNRWAESYEAFRAAEIEAATGRTTAELEDQQVQLQRKIEAARAELLIFREASDIVSLERGENRSLAALRGLNDSLNRARERLIEARARKSAVDEAIARGETVIPNEQKAALGQLQRELQRSRLRLAELKQQYTQDYIDLNPTLKALPAEIREMEKELAHGLSLARVTVRDEAQQAVKAAQVAVATLEQNLTEHQGKVQSFTDRFKEFKMLEEDLERLERLHADNQERLAQIEVSNLQKYPPIQIVEWAGLPTRPIYPDYQRDLMIALGAALTLALFVTWLFDYLGERAPPGQPQGYLGVRIITGDPSQSLGAPHPEDRLAFRQTHAARLDPPPGELPLLPRELAGAEVESLLSVSDAATTGCVTLLLSGVSPHELSLLKGSCIDRSSGRIRVPGASRRELALDARVWPRLAGVLDAIDATGTALPTAALEARLGEAARAAQLADPRSVDALAVWHTYVVYLVRQGIDAGALAQRVGAVPADVLDRLLQHAPPAGNRPPSAIDFTYPALI